MTKKEQIMATLEKMGYNPDYDNDGDIMLRYEMKTIFVMTDNEDETYVSVILPQFYEIEDGEETLVLVTCNKVSCELKMVKAYIDQTFKNVSASCEFFFTNEDALELNLRHSLELLGMIRSTFRKKMKELSD